jgi:hypothetical protein
MIKTKVSAQISRPVSQVFDYLTNVEHFPNIYTGIVREALQLTPPPMSEGTRFETVGSFLGLRFELRLVVTAYEPDRQFCVATKWGPIPFQGCYDLEAVEGGTLLTDRHSISASGIFSLAGSLLVGQLKQQAERNLANIKHLVEAQMGMSEVGDRDAAGGER